MLRVVTDDAAREDLAAVGRDLPVGGVANAGNGLEAEVERYVESFAGELDDDWRRLVVRNGHAKPRTITTVAGAVVSKRPG